MPDNYPGASEAIRNLSQIPVGYKIVETIGKFRLVDFSPKFCNGAQLWLVNERGFLWEPVDDRESALSYLAVHGDEG